MLCVCVCARCMLPPPQIITFSRSSTSSTEPAKSSTAEKQKHLKKGILFFFFFHKTKDYLLSHMCGIYLLHVMWSCVKYYKKPFTVYVGTFSLIYTQRTLKPLSSLKTQRKKKNSTNKFYFSCVNHSDVILR